LDGNGLAHNWGDLVLHGKIKGSAVLFLLTPFQTGAKNAFEPCLLLNKRSQKVLQPGDLCCPGGGVEPLYKILSNTLFWPFSPLHKWPAWRKWKAKDRQKARGLALLLTTALREGWEEMRLNPLKVSFMGPLPVQKLIMFNRKIYPLVGWVPPNMPLTPNWEVERIVHIPLRRLFDYRNYARYRISFKTKDGDVQRKEDFPCFLHRGRKDEEILWGATFRITMDFLKLVFGFEVPDLSQAPVITRRLGSAYLNGSLMQPEKADPNRCTS
jgi:hypothetical protein